MLLRLALPELFFIAVGIEIAARVGRVNLVNEIQLTVSLAEFVFGINKNQPLFCGYFLTACKEFTCPVFNNGIIFCRNNALPDNLFFRYIQVMSFVGFGGRSDDGLRKAFVLTHAIRQLYTALLTASFLIGAPCRTCKDGAYNHFDAESFAFQANCNHGIGCRKLPIGADISSSIEELCGYLVQNLPLEGDAFGKHDIECRYSIRGDHYNKVVVDVVNVADFTVVNILLSIEMEVSVS